MISAADLGAGVLLRTRRMAIATFPFLDPVKTSAITVVRLLHRSQHFPSAPSEESDDEEGPSLSVIIFQVNPVVVPTVRGTG